MISEFQLDEGIVAQLMDMGFPLEGCKKAVFHTKNAGAEAAMNWVMEHMGDPGKWFSFLFFTYEPPRGKTNNVVSEQVRHKPGCRSTKDS